MHPIKHHYFPTLQAAWEGINEYIVNQEEEIRSMEGGTYGTEMVTYNTFLSIGKTWVDPNFNFGKVLGYKNKKWSKLINNYVNFDYLDLVKSEVRDRESKKAKSYNYTFHFDNSHGSGKDCLISLTFMRKITSESPIVIYNTRASEATKRMIFDFLLIQRIVEYVYGEGVTVEMMAYIPFVFVNVESYIIYMAWKGVKKAVKVKKGEKPTPFQNRCIEKYHEFNTRDAKSIKYRVHRRAAEQVQRDENGNPISGAPDYFAKDIKFENKRIRKVADSKIKKLNEGIL